MGQLAVEEVAWKVIVHDLWTASFDVSFFYAANVSLSGKASVNACFCAENMRVSLYFAADWDF